MPERDRYPTRNTPRRWEPAPTLRTNNLRRATEQIVAPPTTAAPKPRHPITGTPSHPDSRNTRSHVGAGSGAENKVLLPPAFGQDIPADRRGTFIGLEAIWGSSPQAAGSQGVGDHPTGISDQMTDQRPGSQAGQRVGWRLGVSSEKRGRGGEREDS